VSTGPNKLLQVDVIDSEEGLIEIAQEWSNLLPRSHNDTIFLTFEWLSTWWKHFKDNRELRVLTARNEDGELIGIAPLMIYRRRLLSLLSLKVMEFLGSGHSDYLDFILLKGREEEILGAFFRYLREHGDEWDLLDLVDIPEDSMTLRYVRKLTLKHMDRIENVCPYITLPKSWDSFLLSLPKKRRRNFQYYLRRLKRDFSFQFGTVGGGDLQEKIDRLYSLHESRWRTKGTLGVFSDRKFAQFHRDIILKSFERGWLRLYYISLNGNIVSVLYAFRYGQRICYYQSGFDPEYSKYSLGTITIGCCIESAISEGVKEFDFLRGDEPYKYDWGANRARRNVRCRIFNRSLKARLYHLGIVLSQRYKILRKVRALEEGLLRTIRRASRKSK